MARGGGGSGQRPPKKKKIAKPEDAKRPGRPLWNPEEDVPALRAIPLKSIVPACKRLPIANGNGNNKKKKNNAAIAAAAAMPIAANTATAIATDSDDASPTETEIETRYMGFCCKICRCPPDKQDHMPQGDHGNMIHRYIQSSEGGLYHRTCCHGVTTLDGIQEWATLYEAAEERIGDDDDNDNANQDGMAHGDSPFRWVTYEELYDSYTTAKRQEAALYNADGDAHPLDRLMTNENYIEGIMKPFAEFTEKVHTLDQQHRRPVVVLNAFAGIGTGILVLKRLGIDIAKIIHVEHDKVATHVYRTNHDPTYNNNTNNNASRQQSAEEEDDSIPHVFLEDWECFEHNWRIICEEHGPIDIILGGPPGSDYSKANPYRQGAQGTQGQYMLRFGRTIREVERYQSRLRSDPLFFLATNLYLAPGDDDLEQIKDAFGMGWDPIQLDALYFSPTRRNHHFFTNIPCPDVDFTKEISMQGPSSCLEEGFCVPAHLVEPHIAAKAQCFMASKSRIDDFQTLRMFVFQDKSDEPKIKQEQGRRRKKAKKSGSQPETPKMYYGRPMTTMEREKLMGYHVGYVESPVQDLFTSLVENALSRKFMSDLPPWKASLPEKYHTFVGNYHALACKNVHRFEVRSNDPPFVYLKLAPPDPSDQPPFFNAEEYAKHLMEMAYSVPVVEILLAPLQKLYKTRMYPKFMYSYAWENPQTADV